MNNKIILVIISLFLCIKITHAKDIAVVATSVDNVQNLLKQYKIPFDQLHFKDLEKKEKIAEYKIIFFPSGMEPTIESNLVVQSLRLTIKSVSIKKSFYNYNKNRIIKNIKKYINNGGRAYFSGYSYRYIQKAFGILQFHDAFPPMGMPGKMLISHERDMSLFCKKEKDQVYVNTSGWIAIKSAQNSEILTRAAYNTPRGKRSGPLIFIFAPEDGFLIYTSYHERARDIFRRYIIYRLIGYDMIQKIVNRVKTWNGTITGKIADAIHHGESYRSYNVKLLKGENNIYFSSKNQNFQIDIQDSTGKLIHSRDFVKTDEVFTIDVKQDELCRIAVYPDDTKRFNMYTIIATHGAAPLPYFPVIQIICIFLGIAFVAFVLYRLITGNKVFTYHK